jgi:hypothetical protein
MAAQDNGNRPSVPDRALCGRRPGSRIEWTLMNLSGDPDGLAALKAFQEGNRDYLKFLIQEARTVFEHQVDFKGASGAQFRLHFDVKTGDFRVEKKP